jgi:hypothetical protein
MKIEAYNIGGQWAFDDLRHFIFADPLHQSVCKVLDQQSNTHGLGTAVSVEMRNRPFRSKYDVLELTKMREEDDATWYLIEELGKEVRLCGLLRRYFSPAPRALFVAIGHPSACRRWEWVRKIWWNLHLIK